MDNFGLREKKRAKLKVGLLDEMIHLLKTKDINHISVEELCYNSNTTKVTFFKYFSHKEQVLDYFIMRWLYDRSYEVYSKHFHGRDGLKQIFRAISLEHGVGKKIMISLIHYYIKLTDVPESIPISEYEYCLFNEEAYRHQVRPMTLFELFSHYLLEIEGINPSEIDEINNQLFALMYGVPIQVHMMKLEDLFPFYEMGINSILTAHCVSHRNEGANNPL